MANHQPIRRSVSRAALIATLVGLGLVAVFFTTDAGPAVLFGAGCAGLVGTVLGGIGAARERARALSVPAIVFGALTVLIVVGLTLFALAFVGAI